MIDSHCHLDLPPFVPDWQAVVARAQSAGITRLLVPGTTCDGWQRQVSMALQCSQLDIAFGLHPYFFPAEPAAALAALSRQLSQTTIKAVAVGEIGIDGAIGVPLDAQQALFEAQLKLAKTFELPVILHHRRSHHLLLESIKRCKFTFGGVVHAFSGSPQVARAYIDLGFKLGIGGTITYERAVKTRQTVAEVSLQHLLLETDAPDMPMAGRQGLRNSPEYLPDVVAALASLQQLPVSQIIAITDDNYRAVFGSVTQCK